MLGRAAVADHQARPLGARGEAVSPVAFQSLQGQSVLGSPGNQPAFGAGPRHSETTQIPVRLDFDTVVPGFARAMAHLDQAATKELDKAEIDPRLRELIRIRASS
jgi:hypothetical protein